MALRIRVDKTQNENDVFQRDTQNITNQKPNAKDGLTTAMLINTGKQMIMQSTNKIANHIGKSYEMRKANELMGLISDGVIAFSSPAGAIAMTAKYSMQIFESVLEQQNANREWSLAWQRSGNSVLGRQ